MADENEAESSPAIEDSTDIMTENEPEESSTPENTEPEAESTSEEGEIEASTVDAGKSENGNGKKGNKGAERRIKQLTAKLKAMEERLNAPKPTESPDAKDLKEPSAPKVDQFETWDAYETAQNEFLKQRDEYVAEKTRREQKVATQKANQEEQKKKILAEITKREVKTMQRNPDYDRNEAYSTVRPSPTMDGFFVDSDIGPDMLWELHNDPDEADRIRELSPWKQVRELVRFEDRLSSQIKGTSKASSKSTPTYVDDKGASPKTEEPLWEKLYK